MRVQEGNPRVPRPLLFVACALAATLGLSAPAFAVAPSVQTADLGQSTSATEARFFGAVNPQGLATDFHFDYAPATDDFCVNGSGGSPTSTPNVSAGSGSEFIDVQALVSGLTAGAEYCFILVATNTDGTTVDLLPYPTIDVGAPVVNPANAGAFPFSATQHRLTGEVNPSGQFGTEYRVDYAPASDPFCGGAGDDPNPTSTAPTALPSDATSFQAVGVTIDGLTAGDDYCARIVAANPNGTSSGPIFSFAAGRPSSSTNGSSSLSATGERLFGLVRPGDQSTTVEFKYATLDSDFCDPEGAAIPPTTITATPSSVTGTALAAVQADISSGLTTGTTYCFVLVATNGSGATTSALGSFTAGDPFVATAAASSITDVSATLNGTVNPEGNSTDANYEAGPASSEWCQTNGGSGLPDITPAVHAGLTGTSDQSLPEPISGLANNTQYCFWLIATNARGTTRTPMAFFTTAAGPAPGQVQNLTATAGNGQVALDWDDRPGGENVIDYDLQRRTPPGAFAPLVTPVGSLFTDTGRTNGTQYCYQVRARNSNGFGLFSSEACATPAAPATPPPGGGTPTTPTTTTTPTTPTTPTTTTPAPTPNAGSGANSGSSTKTASANGTFSSGVSAKCAAGGPNCTVNTTAKGTINVSAKRTLTLATKRQTVRAGRRVLIKLRLNRIGRNALNKAGRLTLKITVKITAPGRKRITKTRTITVKKAPARRGR